MDEIEYYGKYIAEESIIKLTDGTEMKGNVEVTKAVLGCCKQYHKEHVIKGITKYGGPLVIVVGTGIGISKIVKFVKKKHEQKTERA